MSSTAATYELGNTPSRPLGTEDKGAQSSFHHPDMPETGGYSGTTSATVYMGGGHDNLSDEEILKENRGGLESGLEPGIRKTTQVDISYK